MAPRRKCRSRGRLLLPVGFFCPGWRFSRESAACASQLSADSARDPPPSRNSFPGFQEMTEEVEEQGFEHLEDVGWDYEDNRHFYRVFRDAQCRTQASICLSEQNDMAFYYLTITSRTADGRILMTWNYPFSYGLKLQPHLVTNRFPSQGPFSDMYVAHERFLRAHDVDAASLLDPSPEETIRTMQNEMRAQIAHNIALGLLAQRRRSSYSLHLARNVLSVVSVSARPGAAFVSSAAICAVLARTQLGQACCGRISARVGRRDGNLAACRRLLGSAAKALGS